LIRTLSAYSARTLVPALLADFRTELYVMAFVFRMGEVYGCNDFKEAA
jgi:hypothetical protein